jgi:hypothetical protein
VKGACRRSPSACHRPDLDGAIAEFDSLTNALSTVIRVPAGHGRGEIPSVFGAAGRRT